MPGLSKNLVLNLHDIGCSQRCVFCQSYSFVSRKKARQVAAEQLSKLKLYCRQEKEINLIILSGNDPGEYFDLVNFLKNIKKITPAQVVVQSNGLAFGNRIFLKELLAVGNISSFQLPIYGHNAKLHDFVVGKKGSFDMIIRVLGNFKKLGFGNLKLHTLFLKQNEDYLPELVNFLLSFGLPVDASLVCLPGYQGKYDRGVLANAPDLKKVFSFFKKEAKLIKRYNQNLFFYDLPFCLAPGAINLSFRDEQARGGYDHFRKKKIDMAKSRGESVAAYRILKKSSKCRSCLFGKKCKGITSPYLDLKLFSPQPAKLE